MKSEEDSMKRATLKRLLALAATGMMAFSMFVGVPLTVKAADETDRGAYLTKHFQMSDLVETPDASFTFNIAQISTNAEGVKFEEKGPAIGAKTINFSKADTNETVVKDQLKDITKSVNVLDGVKYDHAGVYAYTVKEDASKTTYVAPTKDENDSVLTNSQASYEIYVTVKNKSDKTGVYIADVQGKKLTNEDGSDAKNDKGEAKKVNVTNPDENDDGSDDGTGNGFRFINILNVKGGSEVTPGDPSDPKDPGDPKDPKNPDYANALRVEKNTSGDLADLTKAFAFKVTVIKAPTDLGNGEYDAQIIRKSGDVEDVKLSVAKATDINLAHGEKLLVSKDSMVVGTKVNVAEAGTKVYTPSGDYTANGVEKTVTGDAANGISGDIVVGSKANHAVVTNTYNETPITGLFMNNLPFILIIGLSLLAAVVYLINNRRKAK